MKRLAIGAVGLAFVVAIGGSTRGAAEPQPPPATVFQACSVIYPGSIAVTFAWPETPGALQTWVDLSLLDNGFLPDTFLGMTWGSAPFPGNTYTWAGIVPGLRHFYRVNVLYPDGWVVVASGSFVSMQGCPKPTADFGGVRDPQCAGDFVSLTLGWIPGNGDSQWLDLASSPEAMAQDLYQSFGPLWPDTNSFRLRITNASYWWRVNTHSEAGWSPSPVWSLVGVYCGPAAPPAAAPTAAPPAPVPTPPQTGPTPAQQQAIFDQYSACADAWAMGSALELNTHRDTYEERQFQMLQTYLSSNCVGIGVRLASIPGAREAWCFDMLANGSAVSGLIEISRGYGTPTYFLDFAKREIDGFLAAARC
jgi:hypothetical protein